MLRPCSSPTALRLTAGITPCYSGLQVQGTANSPLGAQEYCIRFRAALQANFSIQTARFYRMDIKHPPMIHRGMLLCFLCRALCGKAGEGPRHQHEQQQYSESYWQKNRRSPFSKPPSLCISSERVSAFLGSYFLSFRSLSISMTYCSSFLPFRSKRYLPFSSIFLSRKWQATKWPGSTSTYGGGTRLHFSQAI